MIKNNLNMKSFNTLFFHQKFSEIINSLIITITFSNFLSINIIKSKSIVILSNIF